jgi:ATP-binding cassette subfamily B protein
VPQYLLLDEATSSLDADNERRITDAIDRHFCGRTRIVIAHRLSTVKNADHIVVLRHGEVVESGTHAELVALRGYYYELIQNQLELEKS